jgi:hypothetical protein
MGCILLAYRKFFEGAGNFFQKVSCKSHPPASPQKIQPLGVQAVGCFFI